MLYCCGTLFLKKNKMERRKCNSSERISYDCENIKQMSEHDFKWVCECGWWKEAFLERTYAVNAAEYRAH